MLKWPRMPATAMLIPAKYVYVSPTNTLLGYQLKTSSPKEVAVIGSMTYELKSAEELRVDPARVQLFMTWRGCAQVHMLAA